MAYRHVRARPRRALKRAGPRRRRHVRYAAAHTPAPHKPTPRRPKEIKEIRDFLQTARRKDAKSVKARGLCVALRVVQSCCQTVSTHSLVPSATRQRR